MEFTAVNTGVVAWGLSFGARKVRNQFLRFIIVDSNHWLGATNCKLRGVLIVINAVELRVQGLATFYPRETLARCHVPLLNVSLGVDCGIDIVRMAMRGRRTPTHVGKRIFCMRLIILESHLTILGIIYVNYSIFSGCSDVGVILVKFCRKNFVVCLT